MTMILAGLWNRKRHLVKLKNGFVAVLVILLMMLGFWKKGLRKELAEFFSKLGAMLMILLALLLAMMLL